LRHRGEGEIPAKQRKIKTAAKRCCRKISTFLPAVPCNAAEHGKREIHYPIPVIEGINTSPLCFAAQNIGERQRSDSDEERG